MRVGKSMPPGFGEQAHHLAELLQQ